MYSLTVKNDLDNIFSGISRVFDGFHTQFDDLFLKLGEIKPDVVMSDGGKFPKINAYSDESNFYVDVAISGIDKNDIKMSLLGNTLTIEYNKEKESENLTDKKYFIKEISQRSFRRQLVLPDNVSSDKYECLYDDKTGTIKFKIEKNAPIKIEAKQIQIEDKGRE